MDMLEQVANILTKPLVKGDFVALKKRIMGFKSACIGSDF